VGGRSMLDGLAMLSHDTSTRVIVLIAKHPAPKIGQRIIEAARKSGKRSVINFLGLKVESDVAAGIYAAETLEEAAQLAVAIHISSGRGVAVQSPRQMAAARPAADGLEVHDGFSGPHVIPVGKHTSREARLSQSAMVRQPRLENPAPRRAIPDKSPRVPR